MRLSPELAAKCLALAGVSDAKPVKPIAASVSEAEFQAAVIAEAERLGWKVYHTFDSRRSKEGYPDLTMVRDRIVWMELKSADGVLSADQRNWRDSIIAAGGEWYEFRPCDWSEVIRVLTKSGA